MTQTRCLLAILLTAVITSDAPAQFFPLPPFFLPVVNQPGIGFTYGSNRLNIAGFFPSAPPSLALIPWRPTPFGPRQVGPTFVPYGAFGYPYGYRNSSVTVQVITPTTVIVQNRRGQDQDTAGIDLDVESPERIWGERPLIAKAKINKEANVARIPQPEAKKPEAAANQKKPPEPKRLNLPPDGIELADLGMQAFRKAEYGLALRRFRQADDTDPPAARALFLQGHALIAIGKFHEAAQAIQKGLKERPKFPGSGFRPKVELYGNNAKLWAEHRTRLEAAQKAEPKNADLPFLLGYLAWFDGQGEAALAYFRQSRGLAADPRWSDVFLKMQ